MGCPTNGSDFSPRVGHICKYIHVYIYNVPSIILLCNNTVGYYTNHPFVLYLIREVCSSPLSLSLK
jgi:hypothetical protein